MSKASDIRKNNQKVVLAALLRAARSKDRTSPAHTVDELVEITKLELKEVTDALGQLLKPPMPLVKQNSDGSWEYRTS